MTKSLQEQCANQKANRVFRRHRGRKPTENEIVEALEGRTIKDAALLLGYYSNNGLRYVIQGYGMEFKRRICEEDAVLIVKLINDDISRSDVAEKFEITEETVSAIYHKHTGNYLPTARNKKRDQ